MLENNFILEYIKEKALFDSLLKITKKQGFYCVVNRLCFRSKRNKVLFINVYTNSCITNPDLNFGSNQVVFGGMIFPVSAIFISCFMETG